MRNSFTVYQVFNKYNQLQLFVELLRIMSVQPKLGAFTIGHKKSAPGLAGGRVEQYLSQPFRAISSKL